MSMDAKLDQVAARQKELGDRLSTGEAMDPQEMAKLSKEYADLSPVVEKIEALRKAQAEMGDRSEEHTSELQSRDSISYAVFCLDRKSVV